MPIGKELLDILACPSCKGDLTYHERNELLSCNKCPRVYKIHDDIPIMLVDEADLDQARLDQLLTTRRSQLRSNPAKRAEPLTATYFPWSMIANEQTLKRALLYFDKIHLLAPKSDTLDTILDDLRAHPEGSHKFAYPELAQRARSALLTFYEGIRPLRAAGVVASLDSNRVLANKQRREEIEQIAFEDALDYEMAGMDQPLSYLVQFFDDQALSAHEWNPRGEVAFQYWDNTEAKKLYPALKQRVEAYIDTLPAQARVFLRRSIRMPDGLVRSVLINTSILSIDDVGSVPIADDPAYFRILVRKYRRILDVETNPSARRNREVITQFVGEARSRSGMLGHIALEVLLPNVDFENLEDVLELRDKFRDHLELFRTKISSLTAALKGTIVDEEFYKDCQRVIATDLIPELLELQKHIRMGRIKALKKFVSSTLSLKPTVPFIVSAFAPIPLYAAALVAAGIITLDVALDYYLERKQLFYNNGLAYLLDVGQGQLELKGDFWGRSAALASAWRI